jgi:hypothetical protein
MHYINLKLYPCLLYRALHLRFEKGMVGLSFCDFVGTREEKVKMAEYRQKEWPRRFKVTFISSCQLLLVAKQPQPLP